MAARYEIAFISYKQGKYEEALKGFQEILDFYETNELDPGFPLWPRVLSKKLIETIEAKTGDGTEPEV
jgi:hypothetical protein